MLVRKSALKIFLKTDDSGSGFQPRNIEPPDHLLADVFGSIPEFIQAIERFQRCHFRYIQFG